MQYIGTVVQKPFAPASKSAHEAVWLATDAAEYKLEREEGNPFHDPELIALVGRRIRCEGKLFGKVLRITSWASADA
jgi:hypothetical protein